MNAIEAVREVMKLKDIGVVALASRLGLKNNTLSERLRHDSISVSRMNDMLRAMDYKLVAVPRETRLPEGGFEVE